MPEVIDGWYDSGAMPFAALGYPHRNAEAFADQYPADFICEAIDQTRGWFYTLMAIGTLVFDQSSYRNVVCLGHILDEDGRKMSKHLGNILAPIPLMDEHGADALRWFMLASGSPWQARRVGHSAIADVVRKTLLTYWNTVSFQSLYARTAGWQPADGAPPATDRPVVDRWVLSEAQQLARDVDDALEHFDTQRAGRLLSTFVDALSNWYVRRSRRRFWDGDPAALATLHEALRTVTLCLAPFTPVHHRAGVAGPVPIDRRRGSDVRSPGRLARRRCRAGRRGACRRRWRWSDASSSSAAPRVPPRRCARASRCAARSSPPPGWTALPADLRQHVADELNVLTLEALADDSAGLVDVSVKANFRSLGRRFGKQTPLVAAAISGTDPADLVRGLRAEGEVVVEAAELGAVAITTDDVVVTETPREGWAVASEGGESVALDLTLDDELRRAGVARELVRCIQEGRKAAGLEVSDRIVVWWTSSDPQLAETWAEHGEAIAAEVLAVEVLARMAAPADAVDIANELGLALALRRVGG